MLLFPKNLRRQPLALNAAFVALSLTVFLGLFSEKVDASIISSPVNPSLSNTLYDEFVSVDLDASHLIVRSLIGICSRTEGDFSDWFSPVVTNTQAGASDGNRSRTKLPDPSDDHLQLMAKTGWMVFVGVTALDGSGSGCSSSAVPDSNLSGRFGEGLSTRVCCDMPVQIRLHWLRSRYLVHVPKAHVSELLRPPQVLGTLL